MGRVDHGEISPLQNPLILEHIFQYCSVKTLKSCRQVSQLWRDTSKNAWRSSAKMCVGSSELVWNRSRQPNNLERFLEFVQTTDDDEYFQTKFTNNYFNTKHNLQLWTQCGTFFKVLKLDKIEFDSTAAFRNAIFWTCPNLAKLNLNRVSIPGQNLAEPREVMQPRFGENKNLKSLRLGYFSKRGGITFMELLVHFPSLEEIIVSGLDITPRDLAKLFHSIQKIRAHDPSKLQLKHVNTKHALDLANSRAFTNLLLDSNLHLESLLIKTESVIDSAITLPRILKIHASSLKVLHLDTYEVTPVIPQNLSVEWDGSFQNLQDLKLMGNVLESFEFLKLTPNLKTLRIHEEARRVLQATRFIDMADVRLTKCTKLSVHDRHAQLGSDELDNLIKLFPNVENLDISLNNDTFSLVCENWRNLTDLNVSGSKIDECGLTGLDAEDVMTLNVEGEDSLWRPITVAKPNLTCLKNLRSLSLNASSSRFRPLQGVWPTLGYASIVHGIEPLPDLKFLLFCF